MAHLFRWLILWLAPDFIKGAQMAKEDLEEAFREGFRADEVIHKAQQKRVKKEETPLFELPNLANLDRIPLESKPVVKRRKSLPAPEPRTFKNGKGVK